MTATEITSARIRRVLGDAGIALTGSDSIELADFGLGEFEVQGLGLVTYVNTPRYCAKELVLLPHQTCPQHRHPRVDGDPGKQETFRCRAGRVYLYVEGTPTSHPAASPPVASRKWYDAAHEIPLGPGDQYTIPPDTWHWFQADAGGAIVSEFSSTSRDEADIFLDPRVVRVPSAGSRTAKADSAVPHRELSRAEEPALRGSADGDSAGEPPALRAQGLSKIYGRTHALRDVSLSLDGGETVALVGDNGAGKSTLVKVLAGITEPNEGEIAFGGFRGGFASALDARLAGLETVHQDLALCDNLTVWENIFLGRELKRGAGGVALLSKRRMRRRARQIMAERLGVPDFPVERRTAELSGGQRQLVALARADAWDASVLLLDEPTAALSAEATKRVVEVIHRLRSRGVAILLISHDIPQVMEITDRIVVLRQGSVAATLATRETTPERVLGLMTGAITSDNGTRRDT